MSADNNPKVNLLNSRASGANILVFPKKLKSKVLWSLSGMGSVLLMAMVLNAFLNNGLFREGRGIAGVGEVSHVTAEEREMQEKIIRNLASSNKRTLAAIGKNPTLLDEFRFGFLEGKYAVRLEEGSLSEVEFAMSEAHGDRPKYLTDKSEFLAQYKGLFAIGFERTVMKASIKVEGELLETFELVGPKSNPLAEVQFRSDAYGRLLGMKLNRL